MSLYRLYASLNNKQQQQSTVADDEQKGAIEVLQQSAYKYIYPMSNPMRCVEV